MIEFETVQGKTVWVGASHIVSIVQRMRNATDGYAEVKLSDGSTWEAVEPARALGTRIIDATGMHMGASPSDAKLADALKVGRD